LGKTFVDRPTGYEQPIADGAAQHIEGEFDIETATEVATPDGALEDSAERRPLSSQELIAGRVCQLRVAARLLNERGHQPGGE
jgi:hypothetical protein